MATVVPQSAPSPPPAVTSSIPCPLTPSKRSSHAGNGSLVPETPRKRKDPPSQRLLGIKTTLPSHLSLSSIRETITTTFKLTYTPDDWQIHLIRRILQRYDCILCAGTGYGKSLIFESLGILGGKRGLVLVICPLKALEHDQALQAKAKGIEAVVLNEDTSRSAKLWASARTEASMAYMSPEMVLSESFQKLWKDSRFRKRLTAVVIDEAHCIADWGDDDFRPAYRKLETLRNYTGQEIPIMACTATCPTSTFNLIWDTLGYGNRPFWGLDVGVDRPNLLYITRQLEHPKQPMLDILNILPAHLNNDTLLSAIAKSLLYFDSETACRTAVRFLRKCLPEHLRDCVQAFSSDLSEEAKAVLWRVFILGVYRILCATDAAGMGCNIPDVQHVISFGCPKSLGSLIQRWGRGGRDRSMQAVCQLLVPRWSFRPASNLIQRRLTQQTRKGLDETKADTLKRAKLDTTVERFINGAGLTSSTECAHKMACATFSPNTLLDVYTSLDSNVRRVTAGSRSRNSTFELTWTVLDLKRQPPTDRCCWVCNPQQSRLFASASKNDPRLFTFAADFKQPLALPPSRPNSAAGSINSNYSEASTTASTRNIKISKADMAQLEEALISWREEQHIKRGSPIFFSAATILPPMQLRHLLELCPWFISEPVIHPEFLRKHIKWESAGEHDLIGIAALVTTWRESVCLEPVQNTPTSQRRQMKKGRVAIEAREAPPAQPVFTPRQPVMPRHPSASSRTAALATGARGLAPNLPGYRGAITGIL